ncbi:membrane protein, putative [Francisella tularensis subsp. novicida FTG]|nr:membrane protein, putative [Francisella tularensis subsp. novicida FTG]
MRVDKNSILIILIYTFSIFVISVVWYNSNLNTKYYLYGLLFVLLYVGMHYIACLNAKYKFYIIEKKYKYKYKFRFNVYLVLIVCSFIFVSVGIYIYTGKNIFNLNSLISSNNYNQYQIYFAENIQNESLLVKLPGILSIFFIYLIFLLFCHQYINKKVKIYSLILSFIPVGIFSYFRGTSLEFFNLTIIILFTITNYEDFLSKNHKKKILLIILFILSVLLMYFLNIYLRTKTLNESLCDRLGYCFDHGTNQLVINVFSKLYGYFGNEINILGAYLSNPLPIDELCNLNGVVCDYVWVPSVVLLSLIFSSWILFSLFYLFVLLIYYRISFNRTFSAFLLRYSFYILSISMFINQIYLFSYNVLIFLFGIILFCFENKIYKKK